MWYQGNDDVRIKKCAVNALRMREVKRKAKGRIEPRPLAPQVNISRTVLIVLRRVG